MPKTKTGSVKEKLKSPFEHIFLGHKLTREQFTEAVDAWSERKWFIRSPLSEFISINEPENKECFAVIMKALIETRYIRRNEEPYFGGQALLSLRQSIEAFQQQGLVWYANFDEQNSFIVDMIVIDEGAVEVDLCGYWQAGAVQDKSDQPVLEEYFVPQTMSLERSGGRWWSITAVDYPDNTVCEFE